MANGAPIGGPRPLHEMLRRLERPDPWPGGGAAGAALWRGRRCWTASGGCATFGPENSDMRRGAHSTSVYQRRSLKTISIYVYADDFFAVHTGKT